MGIPGGHHADLRIPGGLLPGLRRRGRREDLQVRRPPGRPLAGAAVRPPPAGGAPGGDQSSPSPPSPAPVVCHERLPLRGPSGRPTARVRPASGGADRPLATRGRCWDGGHGGLGRGLVAALRVTPDQRRQLVSAIRRKDAFELDRLLGELNANQGVKQAVLDLPTLYGGKAILTRATRLAANRRSP